MLTHKIKHNKSIAYKLYAFPDIFACAFRVIFLKPSLTFLLIIIACFAGRAQQIRHVNEENGLSGRQTFSITQDKQGFIWIATRFGIDRYDGTNIKNYPINILYGGTTPIRTTHVILDNKQSLWAFTDRGTIYRYEKQRDEFTCFKDLQLYIRNIFFDRDGKIWIGTRTYIGQLKDSKVNKIIHFSSTNEQIKSIGEYDRHNLLIVTNLNIYTYNRTNSRLSAVIPQSLVAKKNIEIETCFYDSSQSQFWIGTLNRGMFVFSRNAGKLDPINDVHLLNHPVLSICNVNSTHLLLGTDGAGVFLVDKKNRKTDAIYNENSDNRYRIDSNVIYDIYKDKDEKIWLATFTNGINILDFNEQEFHHIKSSPGQRNAFQQNIVCDVLEDNAQNLWLATTNGIAIWNRKNNTWLRLFPSTNVLNLYKDSKGRIWAGTYSSGVYLLNSQGTVIRQYTKSDNNSIGTNFVYTSCEDAEGNMWFGGKKGNVSILDIRTNSFTKINLAQANYIMPKDKKTMLISTESGVYEVSVDTKKITDCTFNRKLKSTFISDMVVESDSIIWLATYGDGMNRCNLKTGQISHFTQNEGMPSDIIYSLIHDNGKIWFSSEKGLGQLNLHTYHIANYSIANGISSNHFRQLSRTKGTDGILYFGSYDGLTWFNPVQIKEKRFHAKLVLQDFWLFNKIVKPGDKILPLTTALDNAASVNLNYRQHSFSIEFVAIDYSFGNNRRYRWMLEGVDKDWNKPTKDHIANYTNLVPGHYVFRVEYLDENNTTLDARQINIDVKPPFWQTIWARIIMLTLIFIITYLIYKYILERIHEKQTEEKVRFFINTAHDIRTPLTLINSPLYELKEAICTDKKTDYLFNLIITNLNKLNAIFSQLLDFQKAYELQEHIVISKHDGNTYLTEKLRYWQLAASAKQIDLSLKLPGATIEVWFDTEKMDKILDNLVSNAIKYTPEKGHIEIILSHLTNCWEIAISDNGIGISKQDKTKLFQRFHRASNTINSQTPGSGLGLLLVKQYISLLKGKIEVESIENKGSVFRIQMQYGNRHYDGSTQIDKNEIPVLTEATSDNEQQDIDKLKIKVLVVDDNDDLRNYLYTSLSHYYRIFTARDGEEAWNNITKINPDIVVSDLQMPGLNGFELCEKIKTTFETSHIPVIMLTVLNDQYHMVKGFDRGADDYIEKPFDLKYLRVKIDNIIKNRKLLRIKYLGLDISAEKQAERENNLNTRFIENATAIIEKYLTDNNFSISVFAKEMALSRTLLYAKFNSITGYTPNDYIKLTRMRKAIELMSEKKYSINEIALKVGFEEAAYFSTCFKKLYGQTPKEFMEKL